MNCQSCGAPLTADSRTQAVICSHCSQRHFAERQETPIEGLLVIAPLEGESCPRCESQFMAGKIEDVPVKHCEHCQGMLMAHEDFGTLVRIRRAEFQGRELSPQPFDPVELQETCLCPDCHRSMECHPYYGPGNVVIDSCARCGWVWLDGSELNRLIASPGLRPVS